MAELQENTNVSFDIDAKELAVASKKPDGTNTPVKKPITSEELEQRLNDADKRRSDEIAKKIETARKSEKSRQAAQKKLEQAKDQLLTRSQRKQREAEQRRDANRAILKATAHNEGVLKIIAKKKDEEARFMQSTARKLCKKMASAEKKRAEQQREHKAKKVSGSSPLRNVYLFLSLSPIFRFSLAYHMTHFFIFF